jgi:hypothetical protein
MPYRALTSAPIAAMLRRVAARHGYTASRGSHAGQGDPVALALALGNGELATVLLADEERSQAIRWLDEQAKVLASADPLLAETIRSIANQLYEAVKLEAVTDEEELRSYLTEEETPMIYTYPVGADQAASINLDQKAATDGYEDAREHYPDGVLEGEGLKAYAESLVDEALDNQDLTDDPEEYRARYVDAYCKAYAKQITQMRQEQR